MIRYLLDPANAITMIGLLCSALGLHLALSGHLELAIAAVLWAVLADDLDGIVASRTRNRQPEVANIGKSLDSFSDIIYGAVFPAVILIQASEGTYLSLLAAMTLLVSGALRLSYFNNFGLTPDGAFTGIPLFYDVPLLAILFLARPFLPSEGFPLLLNVIFLVLAALHISSVRIPATRGAMYGVTTIIIVTASALLVAQAVV